MLKVGPLEMLENALPEIVYYIPWLMWSLSTTVVSWCYQKIIRKPILSFSIHILQFWAPVGEVFLVILS